MAKLVYLGGGSNTSLKIKRMYVGDGTSHKVKKGYVGDNTGKARLFFNSSYKWERYTVLTQYTWDKFNITYNISQYDTTSYTVQDGTSYGNSYNDSIRYIDMYYYTGSSYRIVNGQFQIVNASKQHYTTTVSSGTSGYSVELPLGYVLFTKSSSVDTDSTLLHIETGDCIFSYGAPVLMGDGTYHFMYGVNNSNRVAGINVMQVSGSPTKGSDTGQDVTSTSAGAYPSNGISGSYWYVLKGSEQIKGSYVDTVESDNENAYPVNGIYGNYWYVKIT